MRFVCCNPQTILKSGFHDEGQKFVMHVCNEVKRVAFIIQYLDIIQFIVHYLKTCLASQVVP